MEIFCSCEDEDVNVVLAKPKKKKRMLFSLASKKWENYGKLNYLVFCIGTPNLFVDRYNADKLSIKNSATSGHNDFVFSLNNIYILLIIYLSVVTNFSIVNVLTTV